MTQHNTVPLTLTVNGEAHTLNVPVQATLLDVLRERLHLTGTKKGCDHGQCGACTVLVGGEPHLSCLTLALSASEQDIGTIEGLGGPEGALHPMQAAFLEHDAFQCGYCTPGQILSAVACVAGGHADNDAELRDFMSGNLCRCAAYPQIFEAVKSMAGQDLSGKPA